jgi:hypothetical protein
MRKAFTMSFYPFRPRPRTSEIYANIKGDRKVLEVGLIEKPTSGDLRFVQNKIITEAFTFGTVPRRVFVPYGFNDVISIQFLPQTQEESDHG